MYTIFNFTCFSACNFKVKEKWKWHTAKYGDPYSEYLLYIYPSKCTHTQQWTYTHPEQWAAIYAAAPGEQLGPCSRAHRRGIDGRESAVHSLPPPTIPARPRLELAIFPLWVQLSTIGPQLPPTYCHVSWNNKQTRPQMSSPILEYMERWKSSLKQIKSHWFEWIDYSRVLS